MLTLGVPTSPGVPPELAAHTLTLSYNDAAQVRAGVRGARRRDRLRDRRAGGRQHELHPAGAGVPRDACARNARRHGAVLILDEVMTGFRVAKGGAQQLYGIKPDLTTLGKIVGGGMPVGVFGGRRDIMSHIAPLGPVYQAGTLSGNPVAMAAGLATLNGIDAPGFHAQTRRADGPARRRHRAGREAGRHPARDQPRLRHVRAVLHGGAEP